MKLVVVSVYDSKVSAFATPFFVRSRGEALRSFEDACGDEKLPFRAHPEDYALYIVGEFEDSAGMLMPMDAPYRLCAASDFVIRPSNPANPSRRVVDGHARQTDLETFLAS